MMTAAFTRPVSYMGWFLQPGCEYVMSRSFFEKVMGELQGRGVADPLDDPASAFNSFERRYAGHQLVGNSRLAIYRERGLGDALMLTGLTRWIKECNPDANIDVYSQPSVADIWHANTDVNLIPQPPVLDAMRNPKVLHLMFEGMVESNMRRDQGCIYDAFLSFSGWQPNQVPDEYKRPYVTWTPQDQQQLAEWRGKRKAEKYILWQWCPSGANRMYPPELSSQTILALAEHIRVIVVGHPEPDIPAPLFDHPNVLDSFGKLPSFRMLWPLMQDARCVVGPDSCLIHLAGAFPHVPAVSLWAPFDSNSRVRYYKNVHVLSAHQSCPHSPCYAQFSLLPRHLCVNAAGYVGETQKWCAALATIKPETIVEKVLKLI